MSIHDHDNIKVDRILTLARENGVYNEIMKEAVCLCIFYSTSRRILKAGPLAQKILQNFPEGVIVSDLNDIIQDKTNFEEHESLMQPDSSWIQVRYGDTQTFYRQESNTRINSLKVSGVINGSIFNLMTLLHEVDLIPSLLRGAPGVSIEATEFARDSCFRRVLHFVIALPWPLGVRDVLFLIESFEGRGRNIDFMARSINSWKGNPVPEPKEGVSRFILHKIDGCFTPFTRDGEEKVHVNITADLDLCMKYVPTGLVNFASKHLLYYAFKIFAGKVSCIPEEHKKRIKADPEFYDYLKERIRVRLAEEQHQNLELR